MAGTFLIFLIPVLFLGVLVAWPLIVVVHRSLAGVDFDRVIEVLTRASTRRILWFTLWQALVSTALTLLVGLPIAHMLARYRFAGRGALRSIAVVPFVLPTVVVAAAFNTVFDRTGFDGQRTIWAILGAHVFFNVAVVIRVVGGYWEGLDPSLEQAARVLGANPVATFRRITLPRLTPVIVGAGLLVFLFSFTSFGVILILGGPRRATLETEIYRYAISRQEFDVAAVLALVQLVIVVVLATMSAWFQRKYASTNQGGGRRSAVPVNTLARVVHVGAVLGLVSIVIGLPLVALIERSFLVGSNLGEEGQRYGLGNYAELATPVGLLPTSALQAVGTSLKFALLASLVAGVVGLASALSIVRGGRAGRFVEAASLVPLGISAVTLGLGYLLAFTVLDLRRSTWLVPLAHSVMGLPFVLASVVPALRSIDNRLREAGAILGASPRQILALIDWPIVRRPLLTGAGFAATISMGEFGATSFLARGRGSFTAPLAIFRLLSQPGALIRGQAIALSVVMGLLVAVLAAMLERFRGRGVSLL